MKKFCLLVMLASLLVAASAGAGTRAAGALKACTFVTSNEAGPVENVKLLDTAAPHRSGTLAFNGAGLHQSGVKFTLSTRGVALTSFPVQTSGLLTITVRLATKPPRTKVLHITLDATTAGVQQGVCTPR
jgi:hypothetical protein